MKEVHNSQNTNRGPRKRTAKAALLLLSSIALGLSLTEACLRISDIGYGNSPHDPDPILHHVNPRSYTFKSYSMSGEYGGHKVHFDRNGLVANPKRQTDKIGDCRIAFLGDSFTEAGTVAYKDSFVGLLDSVTDCVVHNYGVDSYSPILYYLQWIVMVKDWKPNIVIVQLYSNDMAADEQYMRIATLDTVGKPIAIPGPSGYWLNRQLRKSYTLRLIRRAQLTIEWMISHWGENKNVIGDFVEEDPEISKVSSEMLIMLKNEVTNSGSRFSFFVVPSKFRLQHRDRKYTDLEFADKWRSWAAVRGIEYIDLVRPFQAARLSGRNLFFEQDPHFTEDGHRVVAEVIDRMYPTVFRSFWHPSKVIETHKIEKGSQ